MRRRKMILSSDCNDNDRRERYLERNTNLSLICPSFQWTNPFTIGPTAITNDDLITKGDRTERESTLEEAGQLAEEDLQLKKIALARSIVDMEEKRRAIKATKRNIAVQKRTLKFYHRELERHCCICGGIHVGTDHRMTKKQNCNMMKMKQKVSGYLQNSLEESNGRLEDLEAILQQGIRENADAKNNMNQSLISFVQSTCVVIDESGGQ